MDNRMTKREFAEYLKDNITDYLPEEYRESCIEIQEMKKNNDHTTIGIVIRKPGESIAPILYIEDAYRNYEEGGKLEEISKEYAELRMTLEDSTINFEDCMHIFDYNWVKDKLSIRLCDPDYNKELLQDRVYTMHGDFACIYYVSFYQDKEGIAASPVTYEQFQEWNVTEEQLHNDALMSNREEGLFFADMSSYLCKSQNDIEHIDGADLFLLNENERSGMYFMTNRMQQYGASMLLYPETLQNISEIIGGDYYLIPSSIHEWILVDPSFIELSGIEEMVRDINRTVVDPVEVLSDKIQYYDSETKTLENAKVRQWRLESQKDPVHSLVNRQKEKVSIDSKKDMDR